MPGPPSSSRNAGFAAYAIDMRGRGKSEGKRFSIKDVSEHTGDLHQLIAIAKGENPACQLFLLGHSAGGVVGTSYVLDHQAELAGFICESFAYQVPAPGAVLWLVEHVLGPLFPGLHGAQAQDGGFLARSRRGCRPAGRSADQGRGPARRHRRRPACARASGCMRSSGTITLPVLIIHGTNDKATMYQGSQNSTTRPARATRRSSSTEDHYHDLLNDIGKEEVFADILGWIDARL